MGIKVDGKKANVDAADRYLCSQGDAAAHATLTIPAIKPLAIGFKPTQCGSYQPAAGQDRSPMQACDVLLARVPFAFTFVTQTQLDELDTERVAVV